MNIFSRLFRREPPQVETKTATKIINIQGAGLSTWTGNAYQNDIYRSAVDAIARNAAKLKGVHVVINNENKRPAQDMRINRLLQIAPNEYMSAYDFLYKLATQYFVNNNAFAVLDWGEKGLIGIYPINYLHVELQIDSQGTLYTDFTFRNGKKCKFLYRDVIHLRRHFNSNELLGDDNRALDPALELAHAQNNGLTSSIKSSANIRGILKFEQIMSKTQLQLEKNSFIEDYLNLNNDGGIIATDKKMEYLPLENKPVVLDAGQIKTIQDKIYNYLGISEKIVNSSYSEDEFSAFYESTIEPLATQMSLEFTRKIFSEREIAFGNGITFESGRLQFTSNQTKVNLIKELMPYGLLSINQALEILNLPPISDGERRLQTLNVIESTAATNYQLARAGKKDDREKSIDNTDR